VLEQGEEQAGLFHFLATVSVLSGHGPCLLHLLSHVCFISPHGVQLRQEVYKQEGISPPRAWFGKGGGRGEVILWLTDQGDPTCQATSVAPEKSISKGGEGWLANHTVERKTSQKRDGGMF